MARLLRSIGCWLALWLLPCQHAFAPARIISCKGSRNQLQPFPALGSARQESSAKERRISPPSSTPSPNSMFANSTLGVFAASERTANAVSIVPKGLSGSTVQAGASDASKKNTMFVLLWLIACLSALDRVAMSVAILPMSMELGWTDTTKGAISSLFSVGYGLCIIPAGLVVSTSGRPIVILATGVLIWSIATMATPAAATATGTMLALLAARAAVGAGESVIIPSLQTLLIHWTTSQEKSRALATVYSGFHVGTISAYIVSPLIMAQIGWKGLFEVYGAMGLVVLIPWFMYAQDKPLAGVVVKPVLTRQPALLKLPLFEQITSTIQDVPWKEFLQSPGAWAMLLAHSAKNWGLYNSLAWTPTFFAESYHLDAHDSALFSVLPSILGAVGGVAAGTAADYFLGRASTDEICLAARRTNLRKIFQAIAFLGPALALGALACNIPEEPGLAQAFLMVSVGLQAGNVAGFEAGTQEKAGEKWAGLLYSLTSLPAVIVGTTGVYVTGRILDATGQDWSMVFALNACINVVGAIAFTILYDSKREFD